MPIVLNGSGTLSGILAGGLPDGIIQAADLASGVGGKILQVVSTTKTDTASQASVASGGKWSITAFKATITPSSASNKLLIFGNAMFDTGDHAQALYLQKNGSDLAAAMGDAAGSRKSTVTHMEGNGGAYLQDQHSFQFLDTG